MCHLLSCSLLILVRDGLSKCDLNKCTKVAREKRNRYPKQEVVLYCHYGYHAVINSNIYVNIEMLLLLRALFYIVSQAEFLNSRTDIGVYDVFSSPTDTYLQVKTKSQDIKVQFETKLSKIKSIQVTHHVSILIRINHILFLGWQTFWAAYWKQQTNKRISLSGTLLVLHMWTIQDDFYQLEKHSSGMWFNTRKTQLFFFSFFNCTLWKSRPKLFFCTGMALLQKRAPFCYLAGTLVALWGDALWEKCIFILGVGLYLLVCMWGKVELCKLFSLPVQRICSGRSRGV